MAPRTLHKLSDTTVRSDKLKPGRHSDGGGLYLAVSPTSTKSWVFMWVRDGKRREMGLGPYPTIGLAKARKLAADCRDAVAHGRDPISERDRQEEPTFGEAAEAVYASMNASWRSERQREQWRRFMSVETAPIRDKRVSAISTDDVLKVLTPLWQAKPETASRMRVRLEAVLNYAKAKGWRSGENPAMWRGHLKNILPARSRIGQRHHAAIPYDKIPALMPRLRKDSSIGARLLELTILTAARSGEARLSTWPEIDLEREIWVIPASRMKSGREHRVPLPRRAVELLRELHELRTSEFVFPGLRPAKPVSDTVMQRLLKRLGEDVTVHGFRSAFRDWCGEETSFPREVAEQALAHAVGDAVERAYRRGDALEKRRALMEAWSTYLSQPAGSNVATLRRRLAAERT
ncbi:tyrosine-type recombinase/integrase [Antarcticirhabdus aurantiaca]|uniref:Integrase arm-type DNA-binding domain-containing protein n=1 Tax=Antarcticirhabdus aurantiaca TaxID=2606717 RepID=A0ACD4NKM7_9HYPH|nr:site-specific integrase [Antarcticirhabdus aurantiaca]WAJ27371.1 integrase arm-type DNA-binding domain-containing protein [Jeongeuplla avenae]